MDDYCEGEDKYGQKITHKQDDYIVNIELENGECMEQPFIKRQWFVGMLINLALIFVVIQIDYRIKLSKDAKKGSKSFEGAKYNSL